MNMSFFTVLESNIISTYRHDTVSDDTNCAICRDNIYENIIDKNIIHTEIIQGECNHCYHKNCLDTWIKQTNRCPLCNQEWKTKKIFK